MQDPSESCLVDGTNPNEKIRLPVSHVSLLPGFGKHLCTEAGKREKKQGQKNKIKKTCGRYSVSLPKNKLISPQRLHAQTHCITPTQMCTD